MPEEGGGRERERASTSRRQAKEGDRKYQAEEPRRQSPSLKGAKKTEGSGDAATTASPPLDRIEVA